MCASIFIKNILYWTNIVLYLFPATQLNYVHQKKKSSLQQLEWSFLHHHHNTIQDQVTGHLQHGTSSFHELPCTWLRSHYICRSAII